MSDLPDNLADACDEIGRLHEELSRLEQERDKYREALEYIANNTCCDGCQEAARVAQKALQIKCDVCDGDGWIVVPDHHPECTGRCSPRCPIPKQEICPKCRGVERYLEEKQRTEIERDKLLGMFGDYEMPCESFDQAYAIWQYVLEERNNLQEELAKINIGGCDAHTDFSSSKPWCPVCLEKEIEQLRSKLCIFPSLREECRGKALHHGNEYQEDIKDA